MIEVEKLDTLLSIMQEQEGYRVMTPEMVANKISRTEFKKHSRKLVRDKHAFYLDKRSLLLSLTQKGSAFIQKGGYKNSSGKLFLQSRKRLFVTIALLTLFLGVMAIYLVHSHHIFS